MSKKKIIPRGTFEPVPSLADQLVRVADAVNHHRVTMLFSCLADQPVSRAVIAGIVHTLQCVLPVDEFEPLMAAWEIDGVELAELLEIANPTQEET